MEYINQSISPIDYFITEESIATRSETNLLVETNNHSYSEIWSRKRIKLLLGILCTAVALCVIAIFVLFIFFGYEKWNERSRLSNQTTIPYKRYDVLWPFEDTAYDVNNLYPGFLVNSPYYTRGYVGKALSLDGINQYVDTSFINFSNRSFTVEVWVYWLDLYNYTFNGIFGQCGCDATCINKCLHMMIRDKHAYLGFYENDIMGHIIIQNATWTHLAFVYDYDHVSGQQNIYVNGLLDGRQVTTPYQGGRGNINIGRTDISVGIKSGRYFTGIIDQLSVTLRAKTMTEILEDATLCAYYSFDLGSLADFGPNGLDGSAMNTTSVKGRVNQALKFPSSVAFFQVFGFVASGIPNKAFSIAFWINPARIDGGTIIHLSNFIHSWCLPLIGFTINGVIVVQIKSNNNTIVTTLGPTLQTNIWTHVATTYSVSNGLKIYINGLMYSSSATNIPYNASGEPNYITVGTSLTVHSLCNQGEIQSGQFYGSIDELRIYSLELLASNIRSLIEN